MKNNIYVTRQKKGMTLESIANKVGISISTVSEIQNNKYTPRLDVAYKIADALGVDVYRLFPHSSGMSF